MYLTYVSTVTGETKRIDNIDLHQDMRYRYFSAKAYTKLDTYDINKYMHLWHNGRCIGTQVVLGA